MSDGVVATLTAAAEQLTAAVGRVDAGSPMPGPLQARLRRIEREVAWLVRDLNEPGEVRP